MLRSVIGAALVVALFVLLAVNFSMMWLNGGGYFLYEDNRFILVCETVMTALIGLFGVERVVSVIKRG